ncbi:dynein heavy chain domain-containing protein 1-like [Octopus sinensis]|uniref:Dynein heavy chain domain-containing protein 1-like n=1 Tax=Octopus sinensis TaxID=2607531 RepID=A0A6P7TRC2_9MOLL|nr:dynein heavy chain domain-containing protein 1-like [Octopus sinensis]
MARAIHKVHQQIRNSLHMMFILSSKGYKESVNSLHKHFEKYPALLTTSYSVMTNPSLSTKAYQEMITQWFEEDNTQQLFIKHVTNFEEHNTKIEVSTAALTYLHKTSQTALRKQYLCKNGSFPYFPLQYVREMVYLFHKITDEIVEKETKKLLNFGGAVGKVNEAIGRIDGFKMTLNNLVPQYDKQMEHVRILASDIKQLRQLYGEVNSEMKDCRNTLVDIDKEIVELNRMIDTMFAGLNPIFQAAVATLQSINKKAWQEVKSYRQPPEPIKEVLKAVCLLFQCPQNWEDGQVLLVDSNFINNLIYYDKEQITDEMFARLKGYLSNPSFTSKTMMQYSLAAVSILEWLKAIYRYCRAKQLSAPYKEMVEKLKEKQIQIKERLGELHGISSLYKVQLKEDLQGYRLVMKRAKDLDGQIQVIQKKVSEASHLVGNISEQHHMWQSEVSKSKMNLRTAFGDGMLAAASVSYLGAFDDQTRSKLQEEWIQHFDQPTFESSSPEILHPETRSVSVDALPSRRLSTSLSRLRSTPNMYNASPSTSSAVSVPTTSQEVMPPRRQVTFSIQKYNPMMEGNEFVYGKNVINEKDDNDYDEMDDKMSSRCDNEPFLLVRSAFCLRSVLSNYQELNDWKMNMNINDSRAIQNAIIMNTNLQHHRTFWPLLVDPDKQAEVWVRYLHINAPKPKATKPKKSGQSSKPSSRSPSPSASKTSLRSSSRGSSKKKSLRSSTRLSSSTSLVGIPADMVPPHERFLFIESDDTKLEQKIRNAVTNGLVVMVTLVEHLPLNPFLKLLVSCHETKTMGDGTKILVFENTKIVCHPLFYMYLILPIPFTICGYNFKALPLQELNVIDLSLSNEAVMTKLMHATLKADRGDFEHQRLANEKDILQRRQEMFNEFALFREKTMNLEGPLIEDKNILESLLACNRKMEKNQQIITETCNSDDEQLKELCLPYAPMVKKAAIIYAAFEHLPKMNECYFISFEMFLKIFVAALRRCDRGFSAQEMNLRANELSVVTTTAIFEHLTRMMFEQHLLLFYLLVVLETFNLSGAATTEEIGVFLYEFNSEDLEAIEDALPDKPRWITKEGWLKCFLLEKSIDVFSDLLEYLTADQADKKWPEYFKNPSALVNQVPEENLKDLTVFQRAILWKFCCPERLSEVCYTLVISQLGNVIPTKENYNIRDVFTSTNNTCPALFLLPSPGGHKDFDGSEGCLYADPVREVKRLAKELKIGRYVYVVNCCDQLNVESLLQCVDDCYRNGYWLVLNNYHMTPENIHNELLSVFQLILTTYKKQKEDSTVTPLQTDYLSGEEDRGENFRLWVTYTLHQGHQVPPAMLLQNSIRVSCETVPNFLSILTKCHRAVNFLLRNHKYNQRNLYKSKSHVTPFSTYTFDVAGFATIHAILLQQQCCAVPKKFPGPTPPVHWSLLDMAAMVDLAKPFLPLSNISIINKLTALFSSAYAGQCTTIYEVDHIQAVIKDILTVFYLTNQHVPKPEETSKESIDIFMETTSDSQTEVPLYQSSLMPSLVSAMIKAIIEGLVAETPSIRRFIHSPYLQDTIANSNGITDVVCQLFGMPASARGNLVCHLSRLLMDQISRITYWEDCHIVRRRCQAGAFHKSLDELIERLSDVLSTCPGVEPADVTTLYCLYPDENLIKLEMQSFVEMQQQMEKHLAILRKFINKEILLCEELHEVKNDLIVNKVPKCWLERTYPTETSLTDWIESFQLNFAKMLSFSQDYTVFQKHDLNIFLRPDRLIYAYLQTYTRKTFKDVSNIELYATR